MSTWKEKVGRVLQPFNVISFGMIVGATLISWLTNYPLIGMCALVIVIQTITSDDFGAFRDPYNQKFVKWWNDKVV